MYTQLIKIDLPLVIDEYIREKQINSIGIYYKTLNYNDILYDLLASGFTYFDTGIFYKNGIDLIKEFEEKYIMLNVLETFEIEFLINSRLYAIIKIAAREYYNDNIEQFMLRCIGYKVYDFYDK